MDFSECLQKKLLRIHFDPATLPKSPLTRAVNYTLGEYGALCNYILRHDNAVERLMRYISLSRKNSLVLGELCRSGSVKQEPTGASLNEFLLKRAGHTWDDVIETRATFDDIDEKTKRGCSVFDSNVRGCR